MSPKTVKNATGAMTAGGWRGKPRKPSGYPSFCGQCHQPIDLPALIAKIKAGKRYVHPCGRVLAKGDAVLEQRKAEDARPPV